MTEPPLVNPDGNERLTATIGVVLVVLTLVEIATLLLGLHTYLQVHVFVGLVLLPPVALKLASTGWRFARYYTRNSIYRAKGAPQIAMRMLAPLLVVFTILLFGSGVTMGLVHGEARHIARRIHGPASVGWLIILGIHVLVYLPRTLRTVGEELRARTRRAVQGAKMRTWVVVSGLVCGLAIGLATLPVQHDWLHLHNDHHHHHDG